MSYSYISNVYPGYTNTTNTIYNKMYGNVTDTYQKSPGEVVPMENFSSTLDTPKYNFIENDFSLQNKSNILFPIPPLPKQELYSGYQGTNVNNGQLLKQKTIENMSNQNQVTSCQDYKNHLMTCQECMRQFNNNAGDEFMDILAYIVFGIMLILILERL
jgi:hypothetical protein